MQQLSLQGVIENLAIWSMKAKNIRADYLILGTCTNASGGPNVLRFFLAV